MLSMAALRPAIGFTTSTTARCYLIGAPLLGSHHGGSSSSLFRRITTTTTLSTATTGLRSLTNMKPQQPQKQRLLVFNNNTPPSRLLLCRTSTTLARHQGISVSSSNTTRLFPLQYHSSFSFYSWMRHSPSLQYQPGAVSQFSSFFGGGSQRPPPRGGGRAMQGIGLLGAASVLLGKTKYVLAALKFTKLASLGSMVFTIGTYSMFFGLPYAVGMVGLIAVHEAGHAAVMHQRGIPFSPAVFIPFMGAVIATKQMPRDAWEDAVIAAGGPVLGSLGAGVVALGAAATDSQLLYALADFGFMINLFNMMPIGSMDGGRIAGALSPYASLAGIGMGGMLAYQGAVQNPLFYLILLAGGYDTFMRFYDPHAMRPPNYYKITPVQRAVLTTGYFGLIVALLAAMSANQRHQKAPEVLIREKEMEQHWDMR